MGFGSRISEASRPETPCHVESGTVVSRDAPRPYGDNSRCSSGGCGTPVATAPPQTVSRLQPFVAISWEILLRPRVGEGATIC